jgi:hypothetical protein
MDDIRQSKAPSANNAPVQYSQQYQHLLNNQLKLYFNQVDNNNRELIASMHSINVLYWINGV